MVVMISGKNKNKKALVDQEDFPVISRHKWILNNHGYAMCKMHSGQVHMHRIILPSIKGKVIGHINFNKLDNRKSNLRYLSNSENLNHNLKRKNKSTGIRKLFNGKWNARISLNKNGMHTEISAGCFLTKKEAINARNKKLKELGIFRPSMGEI